jgi:hypothetical protein
MLEGRLEEGITLQNLKVISRVYCDGQYNERPRHHKCPTYLAICACGFSMWKLYASIPPRTVHISWSWHSSVLHDLLIRAMCSEKIEPWLDMKVVATAHRNLSSMAATCTQPPSKHSKSPVGMKNSILGEIRRWKLLDLLVSTAMLPRD